MHLVGAVILREHFKVVLLVLERIDLGILLLRFRLVIASIIAER